MLLISLMLAAAPTLGTEPAIEHKREALRPHPASSASRSKRLSELEATVKSLALAAADSDRRSGPEGM
jgi:hypothetical protein